MAGASGFVGRRLVPALLEAGHTVRAMTRHPDGYEGQGTAVGADVSDPVTLPAAFDGAEALVYLVHSLDAPDFVRRDADAAMAVAAAARDAGVRRIVYLGGLGMDGDDLSPHLRSRREVEHLLGTSGVPVTTLRAGIVIGHGGISWEMTRELVKHLPVMITPRWVRTRSQPIAVDDVVRYLVGVLDQEQASGQTYEVGGPEVLSYAQMITRVSAVMGRRKPLLVPVPLLTPRLSSYWLQFVTDVDRTTASSLIESMTNEVIVHEDSIRTLLPRELIGFDDAARMALAERAAEQSDPSEQAERSPEQAGEQEGSRAAA